MKRLKGPELKVPPFLADLFFDLRDRRLLPLVALVTVAIVAVPFLLGGESESPAPAPPANVPPPAYSVVETGKLTVVPAAPGLRDYRKRFAGRSPTDPFKQRYTGPVLKGAELNSQTTSTSGATSTGTTTSTSTSFTPSASPEPTASSPSGTTADGGSSPPRGGKGEGETEMAGYTIDVRIVHDGKAQTRKRVPEMTKLPGEKTPAVMFMGADGGGKKALLLVSSDVVSVFGDAKCSLGSETCDLLAMEPGFPETFVYGAGNRRYRITVLRIEPVDRHS